MKMREKKLIALASIALVFLSAIAGSIIKPTRAQKLEPFFTITIRNWEKYDFDNYVSFFSNQLGKLNIKTTQSKYYSINYLQDQMFFPFFDTAYIKLNMREKPSLDIFHPDSYSNWYEENGSYNLAGYTTTTDYNQTLGTGINEWYLQTGRELLPAYSQERIEHYQAWENYLLTELLPCIPLFRKELVDPYWNNLINFESANKLLSSWGKMYWNNSHEGQENINEIVIGDNAWIDLNPIYYEQYSYGNFTNTKIDFHGSSRFIYKKIFDPLIWFDSSSVVYPHLAKSWEYLNNTHLRLKIREGIKWQIDPEGLFPDEDLTAEDVYFSLKCYNYAEIEKMTIINRTCIDIFLMGTQRLNKMSHMPII
jgi:hypothetical protein